MASFLFGSLGLFVPIRASSFAWTTHSDKPRPVEIRLIRSEPIQSWQRSSTACTHNRRRAPRNRGDCSIGGKEPSNTAETACLQDVAAYAGRGPSKAAR